MNGIVYPDSENAARYVKNVEGWVSRNGLFFGNLSTSESAARYDGCTHTKCKNCGSAVKKGYLSCDACIDKREIEKYARMPRVEWDGKAMIYSPVTEDYYASPDDAEDSLEDGQSIECLRLVVCDPNFVYLRSDYFDSVMPDDGDMPTPVLAAIDAFNESVKGIVVSWHPGSKALKV